MPQRGFRRALGWDRERAKAAQDREQPRQPEQLFLASSWELGSSDLRARGSTAGTSWEPFPPRGTTGWFLQAFPPLDDLLTDSLRRVLPNSLTRVS